MFSPDSSVRGWDFQYTLLSNELGFVQHGFVVLFFTIVMISEESDLVRDFPSQSLPTLFSSHTTRLLSGWAEENYIPGTSMTVIAVLYLEILFRSRAAEVITNRETPLFLS